MEWYRTSSSEDGPGMLWEADEREGKHLPWPGRSRIMAQANALGSLYIGMVEGGRREGR